MQTRIKSILTDGENISVEFKTCKDTCPKSAFESVCAFLNRFGGDLLLGVGDDGEVIGVNEGSIAQIKKDFVTAVNNPQKITPPAYLSVDEILIDGKTVLHIFVPESSQVHKCNGKIYDRNEDGDFDITNNTDLVANMYIRKQKTYTENAVLPYVTMDDFRTDLIDRCRIMATNRQPHHPWESLTNEELLKSAGLYQRDMQTGKLGYTLAAILLFGKNETIFSAVPHHRTDAILRRENLDRYDDRDDIRCNLIESYDRLMAFIAKHLNDKFYLEGDIRLNVRDKLFREVVANLLIHREYSNAYPAKLIIEKDKVTTENSNKPHGYGEIDIENFSPFPKNPAIARVFKEIGWAEELGSGIKNVKKYCDIYANSTPVFIEGDIFKTIIEFKTVPQTFRTADGKIFRTADGRIFKTAKENDVLLEEPPISADKRPPINADKIIDFLRNNEKITNKQGREITGLGATRVKEIFKFLCEHEIITAHGGNRDRYYTLNKRS